MVLIEQAKAFIYMFPPIIVFLLLLLIIPDDLIAVAPDFSNDRNLNDYKLKTSEDIKEGTKNKEGQRQRFNPLSDRLILFPTAITMPEGTFSTSLYSLFSEDIYHLLIAPQFSYSITNKIQLSSTTLLQGSVIKGNIRNIKGESRNFLSLLSLKAQLYQKDDYSFSVMPGGFVFFDYTDDTYSTWIQPTLNLIYSTKYENTLLLNSGMIFFLPSNKGFIFPVLPYAGLRYRFLKMFDLVIETGIYFITVTFNFGLGIQYENFSFEVLLVNYLFPELKIDISGYSKDNDPAYSLLTLPLISINYRW